jgi:hypothetical protein
LLFRSLHIACKGALLSQIDLPELLLFNREQDFDSLSLDLVRGFRQQGLKPLDIRAGNVGLHHRNGPHGWGGREALSSKPTIDGHHAPYRSCRRGQIVPIPGTTELRRLKEHVGIDGIINNAGLMPLSSLECINVED